MDSYEQKVQQEIADWKKSILKRSGMMNRWIKKAQKRVNTAIPDRAQQIITEAIKAMVKTALFGSEYTTNSKERRTDLRLEERDKQFDEVLNRYKKIAAAEGAGTGAGGIMLSLADIPLLISIKMKFLFEAAVTYGLDIRLKEERLFILYVFQLAFSGDEQRQKTLCIVENWHTERQHIDDIDWKILQQEYRDHIDLVKMLQMVPGFGAVVGAYANYNLLDQLGTTAKNAYRMRLLAPPQD